MYHINMAVSLLIFETAIILLIIYYWYHIIYLILSAALTNASSASIALLAIKYKITAISGSIDVKEIL